MVTTNQKSIINHTQKRERNPNMTQDSSQGSSHHGAAETQREGANEILLRPGP